MGHNSDKLYITHTEWAQGSHSASRGASLSSSSLLPSSLASLPWDHCALSLLPFLEAVFSPNGDLYEVTRIIPHLRSGGLDPVTGKALAARDLRPVVLSKSPRGEYQDPVTFKSLTRGSKIVLVKPSGVVYLADTVKKLCEVPARKEGGGGRMCDLMTGVQFGFDDIVVIQDPQAPKDPTKFDYALHNKRNEGKEVESINKSVLGSSNTTLRQISAKEPAPDETKAITSASTSTATSTSTIANSAAVASTSSLQKSKAAPYNAATYTANKVSASLTSTSVDLATENKPILIDEQEFMFTEITKGALKDKMKGKGYVRLVTNIGNLNLELHCDKAPKTCYNFITLAKSAAYDNVIFHRLLPGFMVQGGDPTGTGRGGKSCWGEPFRDEFNEQGAFKHDARGVMSMANSGPETNGSQFFFTFRETPHLNGKHTVFGKIVWGMEVLDKIEKIPTEPTTNKPLRPIRIVEVQVFTDPYEEYQKRLSKKRARDEEAELLSQKRQLSKAERQKDRITWLGTKLGEKEESSVDIMSSVVGKYLPKVQRVNVVPSDAEPYPSMKKKKASNQFGDFSAW